MNPPTTLTNNNPPATTQCGLNPSPNCREESETPHTWVRWANGHDISDDAAAEAIAEVISDRRFPSGTLSIHPQTPQRPTPRHPERKPARTQPLPTIAPSRGFGLEL